MRLGGSSSSSSEEDEIVDKTIPSINTRPRALAARALPWRELWLYSSFSFTSSITESYSFSSSSSEEEAASSSDAIGPIEAGARLQQQHLFWFLSLFT